MTTNEALRTIIFNLKKLPLVKWPIVIWVTIIAIFLFIRGIKIFFKQTFGDAFSDAIEIHDCRNQ